MSLYTVNVVSNKTSTALKGAKQTRFQTVFQFNKIFVCTLLLLKADTWALIVVETCTV